MWNRRWIFGATSFILCCLLAAAIVTPLLAQQKADEPIAADKTNSAEAEVERQLDIRYAKAYLKLVEANLNRFEDINRRVPNSIRRGVMQAIQDHVREAQERVQLAENGDERDAEVYVMSAESQLRRSQEALSKAEAANSKAAGVVNPAEVARLRAELELAQVRVEKSKHLAAESPLSNVRYELNQLREEVKELRLNVALLRDRN